MTTGPAEGLAHEYVAARTVLLDALDALVEHRSSLAVVGAQAVYLRTGSAGLVTAPFTTDGDVTLDPRTLSASPLLEEAMHVAGFHLLERPRGVEPGTWVKTTQVEGRRYEVPVDLIVPSGALEGGKTRGARLPDHGKRAAKRTHGLEAALVDAGEMEIRGAGNGDERVTSVSVAGAAALLVAKVVKLSKGSLMTGGRTVRRTRTRPTCCACCAPPRCRPWPSASTSCAKTRWQVPSRRRRSRRSRPSSGLRPPPAWPWPCVPSTWTSRPPPWRRR